MDFSSAKRGANPAPAQGRRNERHRNQKQTQSRKVPIPPRQRHDETTYYHPEETSSQHSNNTYDYNDDQYPQESSTQWERQPSAHLSEIESVEESHMGSQQQGDGEYEGYGSDNRLIPAPKRAHGDRQSYEGVEEHDEVIIVEPRHPSASLIRQAQAVERFKNTRDQQLPLIGKTGPQPFKVVKPTRARAHQHQAHNDPEPRRSENSQDGQDRYSQPTNDRRGFNAPGFKQNFKPAKTKMSQSTKFDTPNEKGSRGHPGDSRSSETSQRMRSRHRPESDGMVDSPQIDYTPTAASKVTRHRGRKVEPEITFDIDQEFDESTLLFDEPSDDRLGNDFDDQGIANTVPPTPPSDRTLALGDQRAKLTKPKITLSSGIDLGSDGLGDDMMEMFEDVVKDVVPTTKLQLKMPKTVDQVVKHISTVLAKKVSKDQGEIAIKSAENWDWSRLSVLSSEMNEGIKEMEDMIKGAGEKRQGEIENVKRKRVDMESQVTGQYEEFRKNFREACEKMQQPAILGKKFKFGPFP